MSVVHRLNIMLMLFAAAWILTSPAPFAQAQSTTNYDHLIVPGERIGPVSVGASVRAVVAQLGQPNRQWRNQRRDQHHTADTVEYTYRRPLCVKFTWTDSGLDPRVHTGMSVDCDAWSTIEGLHVGSTIAEVTAALGAPDEVSTCDGRGDCGLFYLRSGVYFIARDRNSPIYEIRIMPRE